MNVSLSCTLTYLLIHSFTHSLIHSLTPTGWLQLLQEFEEREARACLAGKHSRPDICAAPEVQTAARRLKESILNMQGGVEGGAHSLRGGGAAGSSSGSNSSSSGSSSSSSSSRAYERAYEQLQARGRRQRRQVRSLLYNGADGADHAAASDGAGDGDGGGGGSDASMYRTFFGGAQAALQGPW